MAEPSIVQAGKYQIAKVRLADREDQLGIRTDPYQPWLMLGEVSEFLELLESKFSPWVESRRNLIERPVPVADGDWQAGTVLDSVMTRRAGGVSARRTLTAASTVFMQTIFAPEQALEAAFPVAPGGTYAASFYGSASVAGFRSQATVYWLDSGGTFIDALAGTIAASGVVGSWQRPYLIATAPAGAAFALLIGGVFTASGSAPIGSQAWVMDPLFEQSSTVNEFIAPGVIPDTDTHRVVWADTPNESASIEQTRSGADDYEWQDRYEYLRSHNSVKGASERGLLQPPESGLPRDLFSGIGGTGFDLRVDSLAEREALYSAVSSLGFEGMVPVDADNSEFSKGVDYGRAW